MEREHSMPDDCIVELYWQRSESAIRATAEKYGAYCRSIARNILYDPEDAEESVNDTYLHAWQNMPPHRPSVLSAFLGKITRSISIDRWRRRHAEKRGGGETELVLEELEECASAPSDVETEIERQEMARVIASFLDALPAVERRVFLRRYWYLDSITAIAGRFAFSESKTASMLFRTRKKLRELLEKEGLL